MSGPLTGRGGGVLTRDAQQWQLGGCVSEMILGALGGGDLRDRKTNFGSLGPVKGRQPVRSLPVVAKHCSVCSFLSVRPPVEDPDQAQPKKQKSGIACYRSI